MSLDLSNDDLFQASRGKLAGFDLVETNVLDQTRWGYIQQVIISKLDEHGEDESYWAFQYEEGSGDSDIDFDPSIPEQVTQVEETVTVWKKVEK